MPANASDGELASRRENGSTRPLRQQRGTMRPTVRFHKTLISGAALVLATLTSPWPAPAQLGAPELTYQNGSSILYVEAPADLQSLTITSDRFSNYYQLSMHCPARKVPVPTAYTYDCTIALKGNSSAPPGIAGAMGSGTAHLILYLKTNEFGSDLDFHNDQFVMTLPNKQTFTYFPGTMAFAKSASGRVKVKIATTQSCIGAAGEGFKIQEGVAVTIGGKTYTSNANGVIEAELPAGSYSVEASWKDYSLGYVAQNALRQKQNEDGKYAVRLSGSGQTLEVRMFTCDPDGQPKARAVITEIGVNGAGGPATIRVIRTKFHGNAFVGMKLRDGDQVLVSGTAKLKWLQGNRTISFEDPKRSSIVLIGPDDTPAGNKPPESRSVFQVLQGIVDFLTPASEPDVPPFTPSTRTFVAAEKGTQFSLGYDPATQTGTVIVRQGSVLVMPRNTTLKSFTLQAGQQVAVALARVGPITGTSGAVARQNPPKPAKPQPRSAHGCVGFEGRWNTTYGVMSIHGTSGSYTYKNGVLGGSIAGNVFTGRWDQGSNDRGVFRFTLAADGDSFVGSWNGDDGQSGDWNGTCSGS